MRRHPLSWLPAFVVGVAAAVAAEASIGLLLYVGEGFLGALTILLATLLGSLGLGLWTAPASDGPHLSEAMRRRWLLVLVAFTAAAFTAGTWSVLGGLADGALSRGVGLALLSGMPLFGAGSVLGALTAAQDTHPGRVAVAASLGAACGAVLTGVVLASMTVPVSMYLFCLVLLSGGALIHGRVLGRRPQVHVVDDEASLFGRVRVVDYITDEPLGAQRRLTVGERIRGGTEGDGPLRPWEGAAGDVLDAVWRPATRDRPVLVVGAGAACLLRHLVDGGLTVELVEPNAAVRRMAVRHLGLPASTDGLTVRFEDARDALARARGPYGAVVVDAATLAGEGVPAPAPGLQEALLAAVAPEGVVLLGGDVHGDPLGTTVVEAFTEVLDGAWATSVLYGDSRPGRPGGALLALATGALELPASAGGLTGTPLGRGGEEGV